MGENAQGEAKLWSTAGFGDRMRSARVRAGLTLEDVGKALGISEGAVRQWEANNNFPSRKRLDEFARLTGVDATWLQFAVSPSRLESPMMRVPILNPWTIGKETIASLEASPLSIEVRFPCSERAFAVEVSFDGAAYRHGDIIVVDPEVEPRPGDDVLEIVELGPILRLYWPKDSLVTVMGEFLRDVRRELSEGLGKPEAYFARVGNIIDRYEASIPNRVTREYVAAHNAETEGDTTSRRFVGTVVEHTSGRPRSFHRLLSSPTSSDD